MKTKTQTYRAIEAAAERLEANPVGSRWHYYDNVMSTTYSATRTEMILLGNMILGGTEDAYSEWCAVTPSRVARPRK